MVSGPIFDFRKVIHNFWHHDTRFRANSGCLLGTKWQKWWIYKSDSRIVKIVHSAYLTKTLFVFIRYNSVINNGRLKSFLTILVGQRVYYSLETWKAGRYFYYFLPKKIVDLVYFAFFLSFNQFADPFLCIHVL